MTMMTKNKSFVLFDAFLAIPSLHIKTPQRGNQDTQGQDKKKVTTYTCMTKRKWWSKINLETCRGQQWASTCSFFTRQLKWCNNLKRERKQALEWIACVPIQNAICCNNNNNSSSNISSSLSSPPPSITLNLKCFYKKNPKNQMTKTSINLENQMTKTIINLKS